MKVWGLHLGIQNLAQGLSICKRTRWYGSHFTAGEGLFASEPLLKALMLNLFGD